MLRVYISVWWYAAASGLPLHLYLVQLMARNPSEDYGFSVNDYSSRGVESETQIIIPEYPTLSIPSLIVLLLQLFKPPAFVERS